MDERAEYFNVAAAGVFSYHWALNDELNELKLKKYHVD
jgi:hypothetical protein